MEANTSRISLIAALGKKTRALGKDNDLLWQLPTDMKRFKEMTTGHPVVMGRKTWESIPEKYRPLPGRTNIVISRDLSFEAPGGTVARSLDEAYGIADTAPGSEEIFIIGGAMLYAHALPRAERLYLTLVDSGEEGDVFFPEYENEFTREIVREEHPDHAPPLTFLTLER